MKRVGTRILFTVVLAYVVATHVQLTRTLLDLHFNDFGKFYYSALQWREHGSLYGRSPATFIPFTETTGRQFWNMNPPHFHLLVLPLSFLPVGAAFALWTAANVLALCAAVRAISRRTPLHPTADQKAWMGVIAAWAAPTLAWSVTGQLTGLLAALVTLMWLDAREGRWTRAGCAAGVACAIKPFFGPVVLWMAFTRHWRGVAAAALSGIACALAGLLVFGVGSYVEWLRALGDVTWTWAVMNGSIFGPIARASLTPESAVGLIPDMSHAQRIGWLISLPILAAGVIAAVRTSNLDRAILLILTTCLLSSPLGWVYYYWIVAGPLAALWADTRIRLAAWLALPSILVPYYFLWPFPSVPFAVSVGSAYTWGLLILWCGALASCLPGGRVATSPPTDL